MNGKIATNLFGYFETLYYMNQKLLKLCGVNVFYDIEDGSKELIDILTDIPRILPYSFNKETNKLVINDRNGLLEYEDNIIYLKEGYNDILDKHYDFLDDIRKIRNKFEHKMHDILKSSYGSGSMIIFNYNFKIGDRIIHIDSDRLIDLMKDLNSLYSRLVKDIIIFAYEKGLTENNYYLRIARFDFKDFNDIYNSELLRKISRILRNY